MSSWCFSPLYNNWKLNLFGFWTGYFFVGSGNDCLAIYRIKDLSTTVLIYSLNEMVQLFNEINGFVQFFHYSWPLIPPPGDSGLRCLILHCWLLNWIHFSIRHFDFVSPCFSRPTSSSSMKAESNFHCHCFASCLIETLSSSCCCKYFRHHLSILNKEQDSSREPQRRG